MILFCIMWIMNEFIHPVTVRFHDSKLLLKQSTCKTNEKACSNKMKPLIFTFSLIERLSRYFCIHWTAAMHCTWSENQESRLSLKTVFKVSKYLINVSNFTSVHFHSFKDTDDIVHVSCDLKFIKNKFLKRKESWSQKLLTSGTESQFNWKIHKKRFHAVLVSIKSQIYTWKRP